MFLFIIQIQASRLTVICSKEINPQLITEYNIYFIHYRNGHYRISTIDMTNQRRIHQNNPVENLSISSIQKQRTTRELDDIFELKREVRQNYRFMRFYVEGPVINLLIASTLDEVQLERFDESLLTYECREL